MERWIGGNVETVNLGYADKVCGKIPNLIVFIILILIEQWSFLFEG